MSTIDTLVDSAKTDISARLDKLRTDLKAIPPPAPTTNVLLDDNFDTPYQFTADNQTSPDGKWRMKYLSGGKTGVVNGMMNSYPATATVSTTTYSTLVLSTQIFTNFQLDLDIITNKQLRTPTPKSGETAWVMFRYTDEAPRSVHHYYFLMKTDGYEFGKKDNAPGDTSPEKQIFIKTGPLPKAVVGTKYHITVKAVDYKFTISVNGAVVVDMTDPDIHDPSKMVKGQIGLYEEDSNASFDNVKVVGL